MKRLSAILLALVMAIGLFAGCDIGPDNDPTTAPTEVTTDPAGETIVEDNTIPDETEAPIETTVPETEATTEAETEAPTEAPTEPETTTHKHDYTSKVTTAATCTTDGVNTYTCKNCKHSYTESIKAAHNYECTDTRPATCSNTGDKTYTCKNCGNSYKETLPKNEHKWSEWVVTKEPTETTYGKKVRTCELCHGSQEANIDPLGSDETEPPVTEGDDDDDNSNGYSCVMSGHKYGDWVVTKEPTETEYGEETRTCSACGATKTRQIDKLSDTITDCHEAGLEHTMSAEDAAKYKKGDTYYRIDCKCGYGCHGASREDALTKLSAHAAESEWDTCGTIRNDYGWCHKHIAPSGTWICTTCGKEVAHSAGWANCAIIGCND